MTIDAACIKVLSQLSESISLLSLEEFRKPIPSLNGSTIGQHSRHTIEFFKCLRSSYVSGHVDYDSRERKIEIESDRDVSIKELRKLIEWLDSSIDDKKLKLAVNYAIENEEPIYIDSSFTRELVYNIEHAIHHMALIKVGLNEICPHVKVDSSYGVAVSTLRHQREVELVRN